MRVKEPEWVIKADRASIGVVTIGALVVGAFILISFVATVAATLLSGTVTFAVIANSPVPPDYFSASAVAATISEITVNAGGLSLGVVSLFVLADAVVALAGIIVALALAFAGWRLLKGDPFRKSVMVTSLMAASALIAGPFLALLISTTAVTRALIELGQSEKGLVFAAELNLAPVFVGVGLAVVLGIFEYGQKLHAETEGLV
jgi:hypothetical protein